MKIKAEERRSIEVKSLLTVLVMVVLKQVSYHVNQVGPGRARYGIVTYKIGFTLNTHNINALVLHLT